MEVSAAASKRYSAEPIIAEHNQIRREVPGPDNSVLGQAVRRRSRNRHPNFGDNSKNGIINVSRSHSGFTASPVLIQVSHLRTRVGKLSHEVHHRFQNDAVLPVNDRLPMSGRRPDRSPVEVQQPPSEGPGRQRAWHGVLRPSASSFSRSTEVADRQSDGAWAPRGRDPAPTVDRTQGGMPRSTWPCCQRHCGGADESLVGQGGSQPGSPQRLGRRVSRQPALRDSRRAHPRSRIVSMQSSRSANASSTAMSAVPMTNSFPAPSEGLIGFG
jgi:hypothetical protein